MESVAAASQSLDMSLEQVLSRATTIAHGTTVGLNALLTRSGAKVGLLTTAGFESTLHIAKANKIIGLDDEDIQDPRKWAKPGVFLSRRQIAGVKERIGSDGQVLEPMDIPQARAAIRALGDQGCESIAICLLWSFANPVHELALEELVRQELPGLPISVSSELAPSPGEYERTTCVAINAYLAPLMQGYLDELQTVLRIGGFTGQLYIVASDGSLKTVEATRDQPVFTMSSGPVAGLMAARHLAKRKGLARLIATDVGGTSFDVGLVVDHQLPQQARPMIERNFVNFPMVDVRSIGTGGGSVAWVDEDLGALKVGPHSAGAAPGPACYGLGGTSPTVTDAVVALGYVDHLAGGLHPDRELAGKAIDFAIARPLGMTTVEAAEGVLAVASAQMADLIRRSAHQNGYDARSFTAVAYGGAAAQYAGLYARHLGIQQVIVPLLASVFSASGTTVGGQAIIARRRLPPIGLALARASLEVVVEELERSVRAELAAVDPDRRSGPLKYRCGLRFTRQLKDIVVSCERSALLGAGGAELGRLFRAEYERLVGPRSAGIPNEIELVEVMVEAEVPVVAHLTGDDLRGEASSGRRTRLAWFGGVQLPGNVIPWVELSPGEPVAGPAFIELPTTTVVVYPGQMATVDDQRDLLIEI